MRIKKYFGDILNEWDDIKTEDGSAAEAVIIATHSKWVKVFSHTFTKKQEEADYCATSILKFDKDIDEFDMIMDRDYAWRDKSE